MVRPPFFRMPPSSESVWKDEVSAAWRTCGCKAIIASASASFQRKGSSFVGLFDSRLVGACRESTHPWYRWSLTPGSGFDDSIERKVNMLITAARPSASRRIENKDVRGDRKRMG